LAPEIDTLVNVTEESPVLTSPKFMTLDDDPTTSDGKTRDWAFNDRVSVTVSATPVSPTPCGLPNAESLNCRDAARAPIAEGVKFTSTLHALPGASEPVHAFDVIEKSAPFVPDVVTEVNVMAASPVFVA
jgi:hypothetical protein